MFSYFRFLLFKDFPVLFSLFINCEQTGIFFRLLAYPLYVSYLSHSVEIKTVKSLEIDLL